jgi:DNA-binding NtrC family response regulator
MDMLCSYPYPGNVRELENIIQRSIIIAQGSSLLLRHLPKEMKGTTTISESENLVEIEKQMIEAALQKCNGNIKQAAKRLGIGRTTL